MNRNTYTKSILLSLLSASTAFSAATFNPEQTKAIESIVHDYMVKNPEVLIEASESLKNKQQRMMQEKAESQIEKNQQALFQGKLSSAGDPQGTVTLVEFFDYQCGYCKKMAPVIKNLIKQDSHLRVIYKEFPIFGGISETAAKAALAAGLQGKYEAMHSALISQKAPLNDETINKIAQSIGLNIEQFKKDMAGKKVHAALDQSQHLGQALGLVGTPAFIIAKTPKGTYMKNSKPVFIPGAASFDVLQNLIKKAQDSQK